MVRVYKTTYNFPLFIKEIRSKFYNFTLYTFTGSLQIYSDNEQSEEEKKILSIYQIPSAIQCI